MSNISFMEKLLNGVEIVWMELGSLCVKISSGKNKKKSEEGLYPVFGSTGVIGRTDSKVYETEQILVARVGANAGRVYIAHGEYDVSDNTLIVQNKESVVLKYLYYYLVNIRLNQFAQGAGQPLITGGQLKSLSTPVPCPDNPKKSLEIQAEIVRILDAFTAMTAELTAELNLRKKQYNYYRDQLLSFEEGEVEWKTLGEVAEFRRGTAITKKQTSEGDVPVVANGPLPTYYHNESNRDGEMIVIARSGAYAGYVSFWNQPIFLTDAFSVHPNIDLLKPKYVYYFLQNKQEHIHGMKKGAGVPHVRVKEFESYSIPVPSLTEQARIVAILDKFDALTNSLTEGLPREIELRQKQYEYYRDLLLSFPKPDYEAAA